MYAINNFGYPEVRTNYRSRQFNFNGSKILVLPFRILLTMCEGLGHKYVCRQSKQLSQGSAPGVLHALSCI